MVQTCFKSAAKKELIIKNPFDLLDDGSKPKVNKGKMDFWTKDEVKHFFKVLDHRQKILFVLAIYAGMRRGEILGLRWKNINFENSTIRISQTLKHIEGLKKGVKTTAGFRNVTIPPIVLMELKNIEP